ncbi:MAG: sulfotransferase [Arenicellales bacterium]
MLNNLYSLTDVDQSRLVAELRNFRKNSCINDAIKLLNEKKYATNHDSWHDELIYEEALCYHMGGEAAAAAKTYQIFLNRQPDHSRAHYNFGAILADLGDLETAQHCFENAIRLDSKWIAPYAALAAIQERTGDLNAALKTLEPLLKKGGEQDPNCLLVTSRLLRALKFQQQDQLFNLNYKIDQICVLIVEILNTHGSLSVAEKEALYFELAALYDQQHLYTRAFETVKIANTIRNHTYNPETAEKNLGHIRSLFSHPTSRIASFSTTNQKIIICEPEIVFIVGMPRSGTTLLHNLLAAHSEIYGGGETNFVDHLFQNLPRMVGFDSDKHEEALKTITQENINAWKHEYLKHLNPPGTALIVLEKMPANLIHVGFINRIWPKAKILFCERDPQDTCLSCYFQHFSMGHDFSYDLKSLGHYYQQQTKLAEFWRKNLNLNYSICQYEKLTKSPKNYLSDIVKFLGLEWEDSCLTPSPQKSYTASYQQVRTSIHTRSVSRSQNYSSQLTDLKIALGSS